MPPVRLAGPDVILLGMISETPGEEHRSPEEQAGEARRMEALGRLTAGIAHDFNNVLAAIRGYGQIALRSLDGMTGPGGEHDAATVAVGRAALAQLRSDVAAIDESARRAASLTRQLATLSRPADAGIARLDLDAFASELYGLARRVVPPTVELTLTPSRAPVAALANEAGLLQAALALILDLRDALGGAGRIEIATVGGTADDSRVALVLAHSAAPESATTARTRRFVSELLGSDRAELRHVVAHGRSTLVLLLQGAHSEPAPEPAGEGARVGAVADTTVLLVEDDDAVRRIAGTVLERLGYRVIAAGDGAEALRMVELLASDDVTPDLLVTDVTMPAMNGPQLAAELRRRAPGIGVLYMSGMGEPAASGTPAAGGREDFLQKPFTLDELAARVAGLLDRG